MTKELLPCPICGDEAILMKDMRDENKYAPYSVECSLCHLQTNPCGSQRIAIDKWNTRVDLNGVLGNE